MRKPLATIGTGVKVLSIIVLICVLSACSPVPTRADSEAFKVIKEARIEKENVNTFVEKAHSAFMDMPTRQQRRTDSYRVETLAGGKILIVSADVFDDGRVVLNEAKSAILINTSGEREAFDKCLGN